MIVDVELREVCGDRRPANAHEYPLRCGREPGHEGMHRQGGVSWAGESVEDEAHRLAVAAALENGGRVPGHDDDEDLADSLGALAEALLGQDVDAAAAAVREAGMTLDDVALVAVAVVREQLPEFRRIVVGARDNLRLAGRVARSPVERQLVTLGHDLADVHESLLRLVDGLLRQVELLAGDQ